MSARQKEQTRNEINVNVILIDVSVGTETV